MSVTLRIARSLGLMVCLLLLAAVMPTVGLCHAAQARSAASMPRCGAPCCPGQDAEHPASPRDQQTRSCDAHCSLPFVAVVDASGKLRRTNAEPMLVRVLHGSGQGWVVSAPAEAQPVLMRPPDLSRFSPLRI